VGGLFFGYSQLLGDMYRSGSPGWFYIVTKKKKFELPLHTRFPASYINNPYSFFQQTEVNKMSKLLEQLRYRNPFKKKKIFNPSLTRFVVLVKIRAAQSKKSILKKEKSSISLDNTLTPPWAQEIWKKRLNALKEKISMSGWLIMVWFNLLCFYFKNNIIFLPS